jgi:hypothetical protein
MSLHKKRTSPDGAGPARGTNWALDAEPSLSPANDIPAYVVLLTTRYGMPRRRVYLDLGSARTAVARAHAKGLPAELVLVKLEAVQADLDLDGGDQQ